MTDGSANVGRYGFWFSNLPNFLTLARIAAIPIIVWLLRDPSPKAAYLTFTVFLAAVLTDIADGYLARKYQLITTLGKLLDPLADKLLIVSALIMLALMARKPGIPDWLLVIIVGRELAVTGLRSIAASEGMVLAAETSGKLKMILQSVGVHGLILHYPLVLGMRAYNIGIVCLVAGTAVGIYSAWNYHVAVFRELATRRADGAADG